MLKICNCCGELFETNEKKTINYCEDCLAKMKGDENNAKEYQE
jgi:predicted  nucleic acid-binding Zn-ribbon protein